MIIEWVRSISTQGNIHRNKLYIWLIFVGKIESLKCTDLVAMIKKENYIISKSHPEFINHKFEFENDQEKTQENGREPLNRVLQLKSLIWKYNKILI